MEQTSANGDSRVVVSLKVTPSLSSLGEYAGGGVSTDKINTVKAVSG